MDLLRTTGDEFKMKVPQFMPYVDMEDYEALRQSFEMNWITEGPKSKEFDERLRSMTNTSYGSFAPNGTLALYLALRAAGIGKGDEVIVPDFTFIATANAVEMTGATPVFADIDKDTFQLDPDSCVKLITRRTKAIMPAHLYGFCCDMDKVRSFAEKYKLIFIEDSAQALGIEWKGQPCGSFGDISCFSFFADKTITTAEGGYVTTNNEKFAESLKYLRNQGRLDRGSFIHPEIGYNFRMTDLQTSLGLSQLNKFDRIVDLKRKVHAMYTEMLCDVDEVEVVQPNENITSFIPFRVVLQVKEESSEKLMSFMSEQEIEPRTFFYPLHMQPCFKRYIKHRRYRKYSFDNTVTAYNKGVCLPSYAALEPDQVQHVCDTIKKYYGRH
tara:strand:+ start:134 stop:1285 length:1152 start_codon:yes stop_codon:yes gene_type:complete